MDPDKDPWAEHDGEENAEIDAMPRWVTPVCLLLILGIVACFAL